MSASLGGRKLGVMLATGPDHANLRQVIALAAAAMDRGANVFLYCIDEGVRCVADPGIQSLKARGLRLFACAYGAKRRGVPVDDLAAYSGLTVLSDVIAGTDRFLSFT